MNFYMNLLHEQMIVNMLSGIWVDDLWILCIKCGTLMWNTISNSLWKYFYQQSVSYSAEKLFRSESISCAIWDVLKSIYIYNTNLINCYLDV